MAIKGLSDRRRLPRIGKVRIGIRVYGCYCTKCNKYNQFPNRNGPDDVFDNKPVGTVSLICKHCNWPFEFDSTKGMRVVDSPRALDHFHVKADQATSKPAAEAFRRIYGAKPTSLDIIFPSERTDDFFPQYYKLYGAGSGLLCMGDGEQATAMSKENGALTQRECVPEECIHAQKGECAPTGNLLFMLPKVQGLGAWQIDTGSVHSIISLNSSIDFIKQLTGGRIAGLPLKLNIVPMETTVEGKKKTIHILTISQEEVKLEQLLTSSQKSFTENLLLSAGMQPGMSVVTDHFEQPEVCDNVKTLRNTVPEEAPPGSFTFNGQSSDDNKVTVLPPEENPPKTIDQRLMACWDYLGTSQQVRTAQLTNPNLNKVALVETLEKEVARLKKANGELTIEVNVSNQCTPDGAKLAEEVEQGMNQTQSNPVKKKLGKFF